MVSEPKPLGPGEKFMVTIDRERRASRLYEHGEMQRAVAERWLDAHRGRRARRRRTTARSRPAGRSRAPRSPATPSAGPSEPVKVEDRVLAGFGWQRDDVKLCQQMASNGAEPIGSLGYDGPLAALSPERQNLADYFKETVAVVTNPAIDREREIEHFSTRAVFGRRPSIHAPATDTRTVETSFPVILGGHHDLAPLGGLDATGGSPASTRPTCSRTSGRSSATAPRRSTSRCSSPRPRTARSSGSSRRPSRRVRDGAELLVLTDRTVYDGERRYLDPHLATSAVDQALKQLKRRGDRARRTCAAAARSCCARRRSATSTTSSWRSASAPTASAPT